MRKVSLDETLNEDILNRQLVDNARLHDIYQVLCRDIAGMRVELRAGDRASGLCEELIATTGFSGIAEAATDVRAVIAVLRTLIPTVHSMEALATLLDASCDDARHQLADLSLDWPRRRYLMTSVQVMQLVMNACRSTLIPKMIHFLKTDQSPTHIGIFNYLSIKSAIHHCPDYRIVLHAPVKPHGPLWDELLPHMELNLDIPPQTLGSHRLVEAAHQADVWRARKLIEYGGFYFDWDMLLLRPPTDLHPFACVMGVEGLVTGYQEVLGVSAIGAQPGSAFLQCWLNGMAGVYNPREYVTHSTVLAREIALAFPASVRVLPSNSFYFPGWDTGAMAWLFEPSERVSREAMEETLEGAWGIHLFESHANFKHYSEGLTLDALRRLPCNLSTIVEPLLD